MSNSFSIKRFGMVEKYEKNGALYTCAVLFIEICIQEHIKVKTMLDVSFLIKSIFETVPT